MKLLTVSGTTSLVSVHEKTGGTSYYRLWLREDGVVVALPMSEKPEENEDNKT